MVGSLWLRNNLLKRFSYGPCRDNVLKVVYLANAKFLEAAVCYHYNRDVAFIVVLFLFGSSP